MRNRRKYICCGIVIALFCSGSSISYAHEESEKQYIVEFTDDFALFETGQKDAEINVLSESELHRYIDAGVVKWYEEDYEVKLLDIEAFDDEAVLQDSSRIGSLKWDLSMINAERAKDILCEGQGVNVGIIDSGVSNHPDLQDNLKQGFDYTTSTTDVTDNIGHGTFVAGLIAANANSRGIVGVAEETNIIPLKCFDTGYTTTVSDICQVIKDAVDIYDCDIINMSLGIDSYSSMLERYINYAHNAGVIIVAAVGNNETASLCYPAAYDNVIGVGSINSAYEKSYFSQYNSSVDFVAPGELVWSTSNTGSYTRKSGTSFSTPLVVGLIASMMNIDDTLTHDKIMSLLTETATVRDEWTEDGTEFTRSDYYGYGLINVEDCLNLMLQDFTYFISPIDLSESATQVAIVNSTEETFEGYCMWGEYTERGMVNMDWESVSIPAGGFVTADTNIASNRIKCFLWESIEDISVIADVRERTVD